MIVSTIIGLTNLILDAGFAVPPRRWLPLAVYLAGGSKGLVLGWLSCLLFFKQLGRDRAVEVAGG
jgi:hypothetical protein